MPEQNYKIRTYFHEMEMYCWRCLSRLDDPCIDVEINGRHVYVCSEGCAIKQVKALYPFYP